MTVEQTRARIQARVWRHLAQNELSLEQLPREELEALVDVVTDAALLEVDKDLAQETQKVAEDDFLKTTDQEEILWEGRPFLSISERYLITDERVRLFSGLVGKDRIDIELVRIQSFDQSQTVRERMLNLGDITIHSHDRSNPVVVLNNVPDPEYVHEVLRRAVLDARGRYRLSYREEM